MGADVLLSDEFRVEEDFRGSITFGAELRRKKDKVLRSSESNVRMKARLEGTDSDHSPIGQPELLDGTSPPAPARTYVPSSSSPSTTSKQLLILLRRIQGDVARLLLDRAHRLHLCRRGEVRARLAQ